MLLEIVFLLFPSNEDRLIKKLNRKEGDGTSYPQLFMYSKSYFNFAIFL